MLTHDTPQAVGPWTSTRSSHEADAVERVLLLDDVAGTIRNASGRIAGVADFLRTKADDVFGQFPVPASTTGVNQAKPGARAEGLRHAGNELHEAITYLESQMERFRAL